MNQENMHCTLVEMEIIIKEEKENPFFKRKDLKIEIKHPKLATPQKRELIKELAGKFSVSEDQVFIDYIFTKKGISESTAKIKVFEEKPVEKPKEEKPKEKTENKEAKEDEKVETQTSEKK